MSDVLRCPVCGMTIKRCENSLKCENNHSFDISKEGYVNLLSRSHKSGENTGDNRKMAVSRRDFLNKNYYISLAQAISDVMTKYNVNGNALDICCGEGYYTQQVMQNHPDISYYGFDLSKEMVRLAAKRKCGANFFVANIADIPICDDSVDFAFHLFAPFHCGEFYRIMKRSGVLVTVVPGSEHLYGLKELMYDSPYKNDEKAPDVGDFKIIEKIKVSSTVTLQNNEDIMSLAMMTPYFYHTPSKGLAKLSQTNELCTEIEFVIIVCQK